MKPEAYRFGVGDFTYYSPFPNLGHIVSEDGHWRWQPIEVERPPVVMGAQAV